ncbi:MAG TPA: hypothetical protein VGK10_12630 [Prolixibacteraceae bacterium]|jgi:hypothetical protein
MHNLRLDGFLGIEFGSSLENVKEKFVTKTGIILESIDDENDALFCNGAKFAGRETEMLLFLFFDNKFCKGVVYIKPNLASKVVDIYSQIRNEINQKYFITELYYETYLNPYEKDDGYTESAISLGKADFSCFWNFMNVGTLENTISLIISEKLEIVITYENGNLMKLLVESNELKNSIDY